jgi:hypothetical protein
MTDLIALAETTIRDPLVGAAGRRTEQEPHSLHSKNAKNGLDDCGLPDAGAAGHDQHFGGQRKPDCCHLAFGKGKPNSFLDPG